MAEDAAWIDEAAEQQVAPNDARPSPEDTPGTADRIMRFLSERFLSTPYPKGGPPIGQGYGQRVKEIGENWTRPGKPAMSKEEWEAAVMRDMYARERKKNQRAPTHGGSR
jgi:hypothetical protein